MAEITNLVVTPGEFRDGRYDLGYLGEMSVTPMVTALETAAQVARDRGIGRVGIALIVYRQRGKPGNAFVPEGGLIGQVAPFAEPQVQEEIWMKARDDLIHVLDLPGYLHLYNAGSVEIH